MFSHKHSQETEKLPPSSNLSRSLLTPLFARQALMLSFSLSVAIWTSGVMLTLEIRWQGQSEYGQHVSIILGHVFDMIQYRALRTRNIKMVLDEADELLNKGFQD